MRTWASAAMERALSPHVGMQPDHPLWHASPFSNCWSLLLHGIVAGSNTAKPDGAIHFSSDRLNKNDDCEEADADGAALGDLLLAWRTVGPYMGTPVRVTSDNNTRLCPGADSARPFPGAGVKPQAVSAGLGMLETNADRCLQALNFVHDTGGYHRGNTSLCHLMSVVQMLSNMPSLNFADNPVATALCSVIDEDCSADNVLLVDLGPSFCLKAHEKSVVGGALADAHGRQ